MVTEDYFLRFKRRVKSHLSQERIQALASNPFLIEPLAFLFQRNLPRLAMLSGTDKWGIHWYAAHYATYFQHLRRRPITLLEIGIGGYDNPKHGGGSLRMWRRYFPKGKIVGLDYYDKSPHAEKRIRIYRGDQSDEKLLRKIVDEIGRPDIIIDDGSHQNHHVIKSFEVLFPLLADNGIYVVEDTQTAYWPEYGGTSEDLDTGKTSMSFFKRLVDGINHEEFKKPGYSPTYYDQHIAALHFFHNMVFVQKQKDTEGSNILGKSSAHSSR